MCELSLALEVSPKRADILYSFAIVFSFVVPVILDKWQVRAAFLFVVLGIP